MTDKNAETKLAKYFDHQENCFNLPEENQIEAFGAKNANTTTTSRRKPFRIKAIAIIAACMALVISFVAVTTVFERDEPTISLSEPDVSVPDLSVPEPDVSIPAPDLSVSEPDVSVPDTELFGEVVTVDGIADWYTPGEFNAISTVFETADDSISEYSEYSFQTMSFNISTKQKNILPDWVSKVSMINERYAELTPDRETDYCRMYDMKEDRIVILEELIREKFAQYLNTETVYLRYINVEYFDTSPEWCVFTYLYFDTDEYKRYLINIETGELTELPKFNILAISDDYTKFVFRQNYYRYQGLEKCVIRYYDTNTSEEKEIYTTTLLITHAEFSEDNRYIVFYIGNNETEQWESVNARWRIYDTATGTVGSGQGKIIRYTENNDAVIVETPEGGKIYKLADMTDVTDSYDLKIYENYKFETRGDGLSKALYLKPLFGKGADIFISDYKYDFVIWDEYLYLYRYRTNQIMIYSIKHNEYFTHQLGPFDVTSRARVLSMLIMESGKMCHLVVS